MRNHYHPQKLTPDIIGQRLKRLLEEKGLHQDRLAKQANLHPSTVSRIIRGRRMVDLTTLDQLAMGLGCRLKDIVDPDED